MWSMPSRDKAELSTVSEADCSKILIQKNPLIIFAYSSLFNSLHWHQSFIISIIIKVANHQLKNKMKYKTIPIDEIVIYKHPLIFLELLLGVVSDLISWLINIIIKRFILIALSGILISLIIFVDFLHPLQMFIAFMLYWILLGVASSIGLGTGLHTFVLYLGPHIAKVTMVATSCGYLPEMLPSRWEFDHFAKCQSSTAENIGFFGILLSVQIEAFLWGFGTALGELPPYFVAKKAADTREELLRMEYEAEKKEAHTEEERKHLLQTAEQINQIQHLRSIERKTFMDKAKILIYDNLEKYGFITILLCASIPNPLFDLAGITCGHFRIPFKKFFTATFIGKAIIKVHIQMLFVIAVFRKETVSALLNFMDKISSGLKESLATMIEKQREQLHHPRDSSEGKPLIGKIWDLIIFLMIGYFLLSIVTSEVQEKAVKLKDKEN